MSKEIKIELGPSVFTYKTHSVRVGTVSDEDIPHYLVVYDIYDVMEGSSHRLMDARQLCVLLADETEKQSKAIEDGTFFTQKEKEDDAKPWNRTA